MNNIIEAEAGENVSKFLRRVLSMAEYYGQHYTAKHNDIYVTIRPESCIHDVCTIYDLKYTLTRVTK